MQTIVNEELGMFDSYWFKPITTLFARAQAKRDKRKTRNRGLVESNGFRVLTRSEACKAIDAQMAAPLVGEAIPVVEMLKQELDSAVQAI